MRGAFSAHENTCVYRALLREGHHLSRPPRVAQGAAIPSGHELPPQEDVFIRAPAKTLHERLVVGGVDCYDPGLFARRTEVPIVFGEGVLAVADEESLGALDGTKDPGVFSVVSVHEDTQALRVLRQPSPVERVIDVVARNDLGRGYEIFESPHEHELSGRDVHGRSLFGCSDLRLRERARGDMVQSVLVERVLHSPTSSASVGEDVRNGRSIHEQMPAVAHRLLAEFGEASIQVPERGLLRISMSLVHVSEWSRPSPVFWTGNGCEKLDIVFQKDLLSVR